METSTVEILSKQSCICHVEIAMDMCLGWHQAVQAVGKALPRCKLLSFVLWKKDITNIIAVKDTLRALQGHNMRGKLHKFL